MNSRENCDKKQPFSIVRSLLTIKFSRELNHKNTCHPPVTLDTLKKRLHPQCLSAFCHPDTLKHEIMCLTEGRFFC